MMSSWGESYDSVQYGGCQKSTPGLSPCCHPFPRQWGAWTFHVCASTRSAWMVSQALRFGKSDLGRFRQRLPLGRTSGSAVFAASVLEPA